MKQKRWTEYVDSFVNKILYCVIAFLANILLTRYLGTDLKGEYTYLLNITNIAAILAGLGIYQSIPFFNRLSGDPEKTLEEYMNIFIFQCMLYLLACAVISAVFPDRRVIFIALLSVFDTVTQELNMLLLIKDVYKRNRIFLYGNILNLALCGLLFFFAESSLVLAVSVTILVRIYYLAAYLRAIKKPVRLRSVRLGNLKRYIRFGFIQMISFLMITVNYKMDVIMLRWFPQVDNTQLSYYSLGVTVAEIAWLIPDVFKDVIFSKTAKEDHYEEVAAALKVSNVVILAMILGMILFGKLFIRIFYGAEFLDSYGITVLLFWGIPLMSWFKILHPLFNAKGKRLFSFVTLFITAVANVGLNALLIPCFGIQGAAFASIVSYFVCGISYLAEFSRMSGIKIYKLFVPVKKDILLIVQKGGA